MELMTGLSVVITAFNRRGLIKAALDSSVREFGSNPQLEILVVDDASTDGTFEYLEQEYEVTIRSGVVKIIRLEANLGVTGAKNSGFMAAQFPWVIFLDSDDQFTFGAGEKILKELAECQSAPIVFFRCIDEKGQPVGHPFETKQFLNLERYLKDSSYGEALVAIQKALVKEPPYEISLRGYEGLGCCRIIKNYGPAVLSRVQARIYCTGNTDRLSVSKGFFKRMPLLAKGHRILAREFKDHLKVRQRMSLYAKSCIYDLGGRFYNSWEKLRN